MQTVFSLTEHKAYITSHFLKRRIKLNSQTVLAVCRRIPHIVDAYIKHRIAAFVTLLYKLCDHVFKRQICSIGSVSYRIADRCKIVCKLHISYRSYSYRGGIYKHSDYIIAAVRTHICRYAKHHILRYGILAKGHCHSREQKLKLCHTVKPGNIIYGFDLVLIVIKVYLSVGQGVYLRTAALNRHFVYRH